MLNLPAGKDVPKKGSLYFNFSKEPNFMETCVCDAIKIKFGRF